VNYFREEDFDFGNDSGAAWESRLALPYKAKALWPDRIILTIKL
jgi:hypothetical protein